MTVFAELSDDQLRASLREYGVVVPVTPSSRKTLERKLASLQTAVGGGGAHSKPANVSTEANGFSNESGLVESSSPIDDGGDRDIGENYSRQPPINFDEDENFVTIRDSLRRRTAPDNERASDSESGETSFRMLPPRTSFNKSATTPIAQKQTSYWQYIAYTIAAIIFVCFLVFLNQHASIVQDTETQI